MENHNEPLLLTPGPLTTSPATKAAMQRDWGSRDTEFIALNSRIRERLTELITGSVEGVTAVPVHPHHLQTLRVQLPIVGSIVGDGANGDLRADFLAHSLRRVRPGCVGA